MFNKLKNILFAPRNSSIIKLFYDLDITGMHHSSKLRALASDTRGENSYFVTKVLSDIEAGYQEEIRALNLRIEQLKDNEKLIEEIFKEFPETKKFVLKKYRVI